MDVFARDWAFTTDEELDDDCWWPDLTEKGCVAMRDVRSGPDSDLYKIEMMVGAALNLAPLVVNEITVVGSRCGRFTPALAALESGRLDPRPLIDGTFLLEEGAAAMEAAAKSSTFKILLKPS